MAYFSRVLFQYAWLFTQTACLDIADIKDNVCRACEGRGNWGYGRTAKMEGRGSVKCDIYSSFNINTAERMVRLLTTGNVILLHH